MQNESESIRRTRRATVRNLLPSWLGGTEPVPVTLGEEVEAEAKELDRSILERELAQITENFRIMGLRARKAHLASWLQRSAEEA